MASALRKLNLKIDAQLMIISSVLILQRIILTEFDLDKGIV